MSCAGPLNEMMDTATVGQDVHVFETDYGFYALLVDGSRIFSISADTARRLLDTNCPEFLGELALDPRERITDHAPTDMKVRSLSLAVAQKCNLGCAYCYAQQGSFGNTRKKMETEAAVAAVELLFREIQPGESVHLTFLGGEPLMNRSLIRESTELASKMGRETGVQTKFSITTNGTLLTEEDGDFFERYGFSVTVSLDGIEEVHDRLRPFQNGQGSYRRVIKNLRPLLSAQRQMQVSARVTVTPQNLRLRETLDELLGLGFHSTGFSPMLHAPSGKEEMQTDSLMEMLAQMIDCGKEFERRTLRGERYAFSNIAVAIQEIHKGTHRPYPCGAGGGYLGVSASGELYACHRFVEDSEARFGDVWQGVDVGRQSRWLHERHVHRQSPCSECWARYLCGGGCHYEVIHRGRPACDYIRGWLEYCLQAYVRLQLAFPAYFE
jgi:uncharacterized protein